VPRWAHFASACLVALGTLFSTFWILVTNLDADTRRYKLVDGISIPPVERDLFNASFPYRYMHTCRAFISPPLRRPGGCSSPAAPWHIA